MDIKLEKNALMNCYLVEILRGMFNEYTDTGIAYIARALISDNTLKTLWVGHYRVTDMGLAPLLEALTRLRSLKELLLHWTVSIQMKH